ncbi:hypothetical protein MKZ02_08490 [Pseudobacillus sp. FSL P4-0506]|uniref:hypothetical protein n=1 Tax=unclassified Pseudobacillus TaxID=2619284 RepID=UPI0030F5DB96
MISSKNKDINELIEKLVTKKLEEHLKKREEDSTDNKADTIVNVDNSSLLFVILYMILSKDNDSYSVADTEVEKLIKQVENIRKHNKKIYEEILDTLNNNLIN